MGHGHSHTSNEPAGEDTLKLRLKANIILATILAPLFIIATIAMISLWPKEINDGIRIANPYSAPAGASLDTGVVASTGYENCEGDMSSPVKECFVAYTIPDKGGEQIPVSVTEQIVKTHGVKDGDPIKYVNLSNIESRGSSELSQYAFIDFVRTVPLGVLAFAYALAVIAVAGWKGVRAILGLLVAYAIIAGFMLPSIINGLPALPVTVIGSAVILFAVMYFSHGFSAKTSTALLGTLFGLFATAGITMWTMGTTYLTGFGDETSYTLTNAAPQLSISSMIICGMIIASLGVLNDVTITQAAAVWELAELSPNASAKELFKSAMKIGRDHIASTVYTISFAYASAALPILMLALLYDRTLIDSLTGGDLSQEVVTTLVGSIGLVLAVPITTAIAVLIVKSSQNKMPAGEPVQAIERSH